MGIDIVECVRCGNTLTDCESFHCQRHPSRHEGHLCWDCENKCPKCQPRKAQIKHLKSRIEETMDVIADFKIRIKQIENHEESSDGTSSGEEHDCFNNDKFRTPKRAPCTRCQKRSSEELEESN